MQNCVVENMTVTASTHYSSRIEELWPNLHLFPIRYYLSVLEL